MHSTCRHALTTHNWTRVSTATQYIAECTKLTP